MTHKYFSTRTGLNKNAKGFDLKETIKLFLFVYDQFRSDGYFDEAFGFTCVDEGEIQGKLKNVELSILLEIRKKDLWPIHSQSKFYFEDDFFDVVEFLFQHISKPIEGNYHTWNDCGMHWETFNKGDYALLDTISYSWFNGLTFRRLL